MHSRTPLCRLVRPPFHHAVALAVDGWPDAAWEGAFLVRGDQQDAKVAGEQALGAADVQLDGRTAQHHGQDVGVARQSSGSTRGDLLL